MKNITHSASKLVLLYIVAIIGILALIAGAYSILTNTFGEASKIILASFGTVLTLVLGYYFGYKGDNSPVVSPETEKPIVSGFGK